MKAAIYRSYGSPEVLEITDVERPTIKDDDRVLIKVHNASVNVYDNLFRKPHDIQEIPNPTLNETVI